MTISQANIIAAADETSGWDNLAPLAGTWRNIFWDSPTADDRWGRQAGKFTFDFEKVVFKFSNLTPTIPANAKIISAVLRGAASFTSDAQTFITLIQIHGKDGFWNPASAGPLWRSASAVGTNADADVLVLNIATATLADTAVATDRNWEIRSNSAGRYLKAGQGVRIVTGGTLGFVDITLRRVGMVTPGFIWAEIYSQDSNGLADVLLATSNTRPATTAPTTPAPFRFTFSGGDQIILAAGQDIVVVLNGDYALSASQNIQMSWTRAGYTPGTFQLFGTGEVFDDQNYPVLDSFRTIVVSPSTGFAVWIAPQFFIGVDYDTPDLSGLLQTHILLSDYVEGDPLAFSVFFTTFLFPAGTAQRAWAQFGHATLPSVRLEVEWRERGIRVSV